MKDCLAQIHNMLINEDHMGQVKFVRLFKVTVLNLHEIKPSFHQANYDHDNGQFRVKTKRLA